VLAREPEEKTGHGRRSRSEEEIALAVKPKSGKKSERKP